MLARLSWSSRAAPPAHLIPVKRVSGTESDKCSTRSAQNREGSTAWMALGKGREGVCERKKGEWKCLQSLILFLNGLPSGPQALIRGSLCFLLFCYWLFLGASLHIPNSSQLNKQEPASLLPRITLVFLPSGDKSG